MRLKIAFIRTYVTAKIWSISRQYDATSQFFHWLHLRAGDYQVEGRGWDRRAIWITVVTGEYTWI